MVIKVDGKALHELTKEELLEADKQIKIAFFEAKQKGLNRFHIGEAVKVAKKNWSAEGVITDISSRTATVKIGDEHILATAKMISKI